MKLILASQSPRRKEILAHLNIPFDIVVADADESCSLTDPHAFVTEVSARKGKAVKERLGAEADHAVILSCDTVVACEGKILGKPRDRADAIAMLRALSGKKHSVISGVTLIKGDRIVSDFEETAVFFDAIPEEEIVRYVDSGEPFDKAGGYAIQGAASLWIDRIEGCYFCVVGLPVHKLACMLREHFSLSLANFTHES